MMSNAVSYADVACGYQHCCGLVAEGYGGTAARTVKCWGSNQFGQLDAPTDGTCKPQAWTQVWTCKRELSARCVRATDRAGGMARVAVCSAIREVVCGSDSHVRADGGQLYRAVLGKSRVAGRREHGRLAAEPLPRRYVVVCSSRRGSQEVRVTGNVKGLYLQLPPSPS